MRLSIPALALVLVRVASSSSVIAAPTTFPYEAVIQSDGVTVRCGPGEGYDPTMKLSSGQRVTVHRHDPGGWYMISPPPGSFSWIDASYVETRGDGRGIVRVPAQNGIAAEVIVWMGSQFTNEHKYFGRKLADGDEVIILGEAIHQTERGPTRFYKIEPPRLEHRWVKGDFVLPVSEIGNVAQRNASPASPSVASRGADSFTTGPALSPQPGTTRPGFPADRGPTLLERKLERAIDSRAAAKAGPPAAQVDESRRRLAELDAQLQEMLAQGPGQWRLDEMKQAYRELQASATPGVAGMIDARLESLEARKRIKAEYDAFVAITTRTDRRDAELLALQNASLHGGPGAAAAVQLGLPQPIEAPSTPLTTGPAPPPSTSPPLVSPGSGPPVSGDSTAVPDPEVTRLDGAGIVARTPFSRPGFPPHVLMAPDGRVLAYLRAERGINLDAYLGRSVGVTGHRSHEPMLRSDLIVVHKLMPVQLQP